MALHNAETWFLSTRLSRQCIRQPIYVTGLARSGTTISIEILMHHPDVATHKYMDMVMPYIPYTLKILADLLPMFAQPVERMHQDGLMVNKESPEAVEEQFWQQFFPAYVEEESSTIIDARMHHGDFEQFYKAHIQKLLIRQSASRFASKNNYDISRLEYLLSLFPDAKFVILVRNPISHVASLVKQDQAFQAIEKDDPNLLHWISMIGHREFGTIKKAINLDNTDVINKIKTCWKEDTSRVKGWAIYWNAVYDYLHRLLQYNRKCREATLVVKYEDLCEQPEQIINAILSHTELEKARYTRFRTCCNEKIRKPDYYIPYFSDQEYSEILSTTAKVARKWGYEDRELAMSGAKVGYVAKT
ncbi:MAG: sulfotransferase family protein [Halobacteriota archaeon]